MSVLSVLAATSVGLIAQTNTGDYMPYSPYAGGTNAPASVMAQTNAPATTVRVLSLQDCLQMALTNNLDIEVRRYDPRIALFTLRAAYGGWDPVLGLSGTHNNTEAGASLFSPGVILPGSKSQSDAVAAWLGTGLTPWGMTYNLKGDTSDTYGHSFTRDTNGFLVSVPFENSTASASAALTQPLLKNFWIDQTRLVIRTDKNRLRWSEYYLRLQILDTIRLTEQAYSMLIYLRENVVVQQKAVELAEQLVAENRKRVEVGALAPLDEKQAESQAATSRADLIKAKSDLAVQEHLLKGLILGNYAEWTDVLPEPSGKLAAPRRFFNLQDSWTRGLTLRPEIIMARLDVERAGIQLKYDKNQLFPQLDLTATYSLNGSGKEFSGALYQVQQRDQPSYSYGAQFSIPLSSTGPRNTYKSSKVTLQQAAVIVKRWERDIMNEIDDDIKLAQSGFERVAATRAAREYSEEALQAEQKKLEQGKSTTYTVLQMQRDLTAARGAEIQALATYNVYLSQLSWHEGTILERLGISVKASASDPWH